MLEKSSAGSGSRRPTALGRRRTKTKMRLSALVVLTTAAVLVTTVLPLTLPGVAAATRSVAGQLTRPASDGARGRQSRGANAQSPPLAPLPADNEASAFAFDPRRPNVVYVASPDARGGVYVFKTTDNGRHWGLTGARGIGWRSDILSLTADPLHSGTLYAGTDTAVYKTVNGGRSWKAFKQGLFPRRHKFCWSTGSGRQCWNYFPYYGTPGKTNWNRNNGWVLDIAVEPTHRNVVYSATDGVRKSTDGGRTWIRVFKPRRWKWSMVTRIAIAPTKPESIYAIAHRSGTGATAIYKSTDAGRTWQMTGGAHSSLPPSCCGDSSDALAADPRNPQTLYAAIGNTVLATTDGGASWQPKANGLPAGDITSLAVDPRRSGTVYASAVVNLNKVKPENVAGGIYKTTNGGRTWSEVVSGIGVGKIAVDPARPSTIYATGWASWDKTHPDKMRLLRSTDGGRTWAISP